MRVSDSIRYSATFTPLARCELPTIDGNTVAQWIYEGRGTAIDNQEGTAARDGTAANTEWDFACDEVWSFDYSMGRSMTVQAFRNQRYLSMRGDR